MAETTTRKTILILALAFSLVVALITVIIDEDMREKLGMSYYVLAFAIIGSVLLLLAGYVWDRTLAKRLKALCTTLASTNTNPGFEPDHDEIIGLARNIERMAQSLQKTDSVRVLPSQSSPSNAKPMPSMFA